MWPDAIVCQLCGNLSMIRLMDALHRRGIDPMSRIPGCRSYVAPSGPTRRIVGHEPELRKSG